MKRFLGAALVLLCLFPLAPQSRAQDEEGEERSQSFVVGLKTWYTSWDDLNSELNFEFGSALMFGPTFAARINKIIFGATYLTGSFSGDVLTTSGPVDTDISRNDLDLYVGYRIQRYITVAGGYKHISYDIEPDDFDLSIEVSLSNLVGGVNFARGFESGLFVSGGANLLYVFGESNNFDELLGEPDEIDLGYESNIGFNLEASVGYRIRGTSFSPLIGYRYQSITADNDNNDVFSGLTASLLYQF